MSTTPRPLIKTVTPDRLVGLSMDFIEAGYTGLLIKNGRLVRNLVPGRHFSFALPLLEQAQLVLVDTKIRNLEIVSQGDFLSQDQCLINVSLNVMYQVVDAKRVALDLSEPIPALTSAIKDNLGVVIGQLRVEQLTTSGRGQIRQYILERTEAYYSLGFSLEDVRVNDISFPETRGIIRQVEGMSARQQAEHEASLKVQIAQAGRQQIPPAPVQQVNIISPSNPNPSNPVIGASLEPTFVIEAEPFTQSIPPRDAFRVASGAEGGSLGDHRPMLAATTLDPNTSTNSIARLIDNSSGAINILSNNCLTIGRDPRNTLVVDDTLCSRNHAQIVEISDSLGISNYQLIDKGSSNGTFVGGQRLVPNQPFNLTSGDVIRIGNHTWTFEI